MVALESEIDSISASEVLATFSGSLEALAEEAWRLRDEEHGQALTLAAGIIAQAAPNSAECAFGHIVLGYLLWRDENFDDSISHLLEADRMLDRADPRPWLSRLFNVLGGTHIMLGDHAPGYEFLQKQLKHAQDHGLRKEVCIALHDIGCYFLYNKDSVRAEEWLLKAAECHDGDAAMMCFIEMTFSECRLAAGRVEEAVDHARRAVDIGRENALVRATFLACQYLGSALSAQGDHELALDYFRRALDIESLPKKLTVETGLYLCEALLNCERAEEAVKHLTALADQVAAGGSKHGAARYHALLARAYKALSRYELALAHYEQFHDRHQAIFSEDRERKTRALDLIHRTYLLKRESEFLQQQNEALNEHIGALSALNLRIQEMSIRDPLTGLYNRRYLFQRAAELLDAARGAQRHVSVVMLDLDHFKRINDGYGHKTGDEVLVRVARLLETGVRSGDVIARYGGEEFTLLLDGASVEVALDICERLRRAIQRHAWHELHPDLKVTASVGIASGYGRRVDDGLLVQADQHLYAAKELGRNRVHAGAYTARAIA